MPPIALIAEGLNDHIHKAKSKEMRDQLLDTVRGCSSAFTALMIEVSKSFLNIL